MTAQIAISALSLETQKPVAPLVNVFLLILVKCDLFFSGFAFLECILLKRVLFSALSKCYLSDLPGQLRILLPLQEKKKKKQSLNICLHAQ